MRKIETISFAQATVEQVRDTWFMACQEVNWRREAETGLNRLNFVPSQVAEQSMIEYMRYSELSRWLVKRTCDLVSIPPTNRSGQYLYPMVPADVQIRQKISDKIKSLLEQYPDVVA